jgi:hypothetical protein
LVPHTKTPYELGLEVGQIEALRTLIAALFEAKFGPVPADLAAKYTPVTDPVALRRWVVEAGKADSLATFRAQTGL